MSQVMMIEFIKLNRAQHWKLHFNHAGISGASCISRKRGGSFVTRWHNAASAAHRQTIESRKRNFQRLGKPQPAWNSPPETHETRRGVKLIETMEVRNSRDPASRCKTVLQRPVALQSFVSNFRASFPSSFTSSSSSFPFSFFLPLLLLLSIFIFFFCYRVSNAFADRERGMIPLYSTAWEFVLPTLKIEDKVIWSEKKNSFAENSARGAHWLTTVMGDG